MKNSGKVTLAAAWILAIGCGGSGSGSGGTPSAPPPEPVALGQFEEGGKIRIPPGAVTGHGRVLLRAMVSAISASNPVRLCVEVVPQGSSYTGRAMAISLLVAGGAVAEASAPIPGSGPHVWRAWAEDVGGRSSGFVEFPAGGGPAFSYDSNAPSWLSQAELDGSTALAPGALTPEIGVVLRAHVKHDSGNLVRAQFEVKPVGVDFDGSGLILGNCVACGNDSKAECRLPLGPSHWRVRTEEYTGATSLWVGFGGNDDAASVEADLERIPATILGVPDAPGSLKQFHTDGATEMSAGSITHESQIVLAGTVNSPGGNPCALEVEVAALGSNFYGLNVFTGPYVASGGIARVAVPAKFKYSHWRAIAVDSLGALSPCTYFGDLLNPLLPDFEVAPAPNSVPAMPYALKQFQHDGCTGMSTGDVPVFPAIRVRATLGDPDYGNGLALEVEIKPAGVSFTNVPSAASGVIPIGTEVIVDLYGLSSSSPYHWQARAIDCTGTVSGWVEYAGSTPSEPPPVWGSGGCSGSIAAGSRSGPLLSLALALALLLLSARRRSSISSYDQRGGAIS